MINRGTYKIHYKKGDELLDSLLVESKYCFSIHEIQERLGLPQNNVVKILTRLRKKNKIISISKGLYAYLPPPERKFGFNVINVLDKIMVHWKVPYYVGLLSAADYYGAAHYKPQILQVIIPKQINFRRAKDLGISLHVRKSFPEKGLVQVKTPAGYISYATPELLCLDLIEYEKASGGMDNVALIIHDLIPHLKKQNLKRVAAQYPIKAAVQRLGFLLEKFEASEEFASGLKKIIDHRGSSIVGLSSMAPPKGEFDPKWKIMKNTTLEIEDDI